MKLRKKLFLSLTMIIVVFCLFLFYRYSLQINFIGEIKWANSVRINKIEFISPFNQRIMADTLTKSITGYFKDIIITSDSSEDLELYQFFRGDSVRLSCHKADGYPIQIIKPDLSLQKKTYGIIYFNIRYIISFLSILLFSGLLFFLLKIINKKSIRCVFEKTKTYLYNLKKIKKNLIISSIIAILFYPFLLLFFNINFSLLYNISHYVMYPLVSLIFFVHVYGFIQYSENKFSSLSFFAFWLILFLQYFFISPHVFAGNFGFHGYFHDYLLVSIKHSFFSTLLIPDTGYLAMLPRIIYGIAALLSPDLSQSIAITSLASLIIFAMLGAFLLGKNFNFLWGGRSWFGFLFMVVISVFPVFSLVPSISFPLSITDTAYYGIVFAFAVLFILKDITPLQGILLCIINCVFILSKAHFVIFLPLYLIALALFIKDKNKLGVNFTLFGLFAIIIQALFCFFSMHDFTNEAAEINSFSVGFLNIYEIIVFSFTYYIKAYIHLLCPFIDITTNKSVFFVFIFAVIICFFIVVAVRMVFKNSNRKLALWFIGGNMISLTSAFFYAATCPADIQIIRGNIFSFIAAVDLNMMRYTIGVHTILSISLFPFLLLLISNIFKVFSARNYFGKSVTVLFVIMLNAFIINESAAVYPHFWKNIENDRWSYEWKQLVALLKQEEYYVPVLFYPAFKQCLSTQGLYISHDFIAEAQGSFKLNKSENIHSIIVLNAFENKEEQVPELLAAYKDGICIDYIEALYKPEKGLRFIYFLNKKPTTADSIVFYNSYKEVVPINTHLRFVSKY